MSINLQKEHVRIAEVFMSRCFQTVVESDVIVPDAKPDILKVLRVGCEPVITQKSVRNDRITVSGTLRFNILYIPDGEVIGRVKSITVLRDFSHTADVSGAQSGMLLSAEVDVRAPECTVENSRKLGLRTEVMLNVKLTALTQADISTEVDGDAPIQTKGRDIRFCNLCLETEHETHFCEQLEVPQGNPEVGELLHVILRPTLSELKIIDRKAVLKGEVCICTLYSGNDAEGSLQYCEHTLPFSDLPEAEGFAEGMVGEAELCVKEISYEVCSDSDGDKRVVRVDATIGAVIKVSENIELNVIEDAYGTERDINIKPCAFDIEQLLGSAVEQLALKESVIIPDYLPEPRRICDCIASASIESISVENECAAICGVVSCDILYLSDSETQPLVSFTHAMPFSHNFPVSGICKSSVCDAKSEVEHLSCTMNAARGLEMRIIVSLGLKAVSPERIEVVDEISEIEGEGAKSAPCIKIYFVKEGDTLWNISKRYKTTPDELLAQNGVDESELLVSGRAVYIF